MRKDYDFSKGKRGAVVSPKGKTRITIMLDDDVIEHFRVAAEEQGMGYQTLINSMLREALVPTTKRSSEAPVTASVLRRILREELRDEVAR